MDQLRNYAPILLFCYKRLNTLKNTVDALLKNPECIDSDLYIFSDSFKDGKDQKAVEDVREYIKTIGGFKNIYINISSENKGLANSIIGGVTQVLSLRDSVIVLEDDLATSTNFLSFMNFCLDKFKTESKVFSISGYSFNLGISSKYLYDLYFLNRGWSWGWATWKDRWETVDWKVADYSNFIQDKKAQKDFSKGGSDLNAMLRKQMSGKLDSWAIRWFFQQYKQSGLTVYPTISKVNNEGFDADATHTSGSASRYTTKIDSSGYKEFLTPETIMNTKELQYKFQQKMGLKARIISKLRTIIKKLI